MTIKELSSYYYIQKQIKQLQKKIEELENTTIESSNPSGMPRSNKIKKSTEETAVKIATLKEKIEQKQLRLIEENIAIENYIDTVTEADIQTIIRMRFIECKKWKEIGDELNCDLSNGYYKLKNYLQKQA